MFGDVFVILIEVHQLTSVGLGQRGNECIDGADGDALLPEVIGHLSCLEPMLIFSGKPMDALQLFSEYATLFR